MIRVRLENLWSRMLTVLVFECPPHVFLPFRITDPVGGYLNLKLIHQAKLKERKEKQLKHYKLLPVCN